MVNESGPANLAEYPFLSSGRWLLFRQLRRKYGWKAIYKQFRTHESRPWSRRKITSLAPTGIGLEVGVGEWSVAPVERTVLSDLFQSHAENDSIARAFFPADAIPFADGTFSFLLSEHVLEHVPDVWKTVLEWKRVLKSEGILFLVLPHPSRTFDRERTATPVETFRARFGNAHVDDEAIYAEWFEKVLRPGLAPHYAKLTREETLATNSLHRQVFLPDTVRELLVQAGFRVLEVHPTVPDRGDSFAVFAQK